MASNVSITYQTSTVAASSENSLIEISYSPKQDKLVANINVDSDKVYNGTVLVDDKLSDTELTQLKSSLDKLVECMLVDEHGASVV